MVKLFKVSFPTRDNIINDDMAGMEVTVQFSRNFLRVKSEN